jgi:hypothetical protein
MGGIGKDGVLREPLGFTPLGYASATAAYLTGSASLLDQYLPGWAPIRNRQRQSSLLGTEMPSSLWSHLRE